MRPGKGTVGAVFELDQDDLERVIEGTAGGEKMLLEHRVHVHDAYGREVARVERTLYFKRKQPRR